VRLDFARWVAVATSMAIEVVAFVVWKVTECLKAESRIWLEET
jgi:hypothetical protein